MSSLKTNALKFNEALCPHLKGIRNEQRYTMRALADKLNTPHSFVGKIEQLNRRLDVGEFVYYCATLGVDPAKVLQDVMKRVD